MSDAAAVKLIPWPFKFAMWLLLMSVALIALAAAGFVWSEVVRRIVGCS